MTTGVARTLYQGQVDGKDVVDPAAVAPAVATAVAGMFATDPPKAEATAAGQGAGQMIPRDTHQHPRLTSVVVGTVAAGNTAVVQFTRSFANEPGIDYQELPASANTTAPPASETDANAQPTACRVIAWTKGPTALLPNAAAGDFTGCTVRIWRSQTIPQNLVNLLLGGVFNLFAASVVGTRFSLIAVARSDV